MYFKRIWISVITEQSPERLNRNMCIIPRNLIKINSVLFLTEKQQKQAEIQNKTLWSLCHTERFPKSGILIYNSEVQEKCFRQRRMRKKGNSKSYGLQTNALNETILARFTNPKLTSDEMTSIFIWTLQRSIIFQSTFLAFWNFQCRKTFLRFFTATLMCKDDLPKRH